jgi:hypothetical protein
MKALRLLLPQGSWALSQPTSQTISTMVTLMQRNQAGNVVNQRDEVLWEREVPEGLTGAALTKWLQANPKVKGFGNDLLGDRHKHCG